MVIFTNQIIYQDNNHLDNDYILGMDHPCNNNIFTLKHYNKRPAKSLSNL